MCSSDLFYPSRGKLPIIVEAGAIFPAMKLPPRNSFASEKSYSFKRRLLKRTSRVHQNAVHIENDHNGIESHGLGMFEY